MRRFKVSVYDSIPLHEMEYLNNLADITSRECKRLETLYLEQHRSASKIPWRDRNVCFSKSLDYALKGTPERSRTETRSKVAAVLNHRRQNHVKAERVAKLDAGILAQEAFAPFAGQPGPHHVADLHAAVERTLANHKVTVADGGIELYRKVLLLTQALVDSQEQGKILKVIPSGTRLIDAVLTGWPAVLTQKVDGGLKILRGEYERPSDQGEFGFS